MLDMFRLDVDRFEGGENKIEKEKFKLKYEKNNFQTHSTIAFCVIKNLVPKNNFMHKTSYTASSHISHSST